MSKKSELYPNQLVNREAKRLLERDLKKYWKRVLGLYSIGLMNLILEKEYKKDLGQITRLSYFFFRHIDDVLDGDFQIDENPKLYVHRIQTQIKTSEPNNNPIVNMGRHSLKLINNLSTPADQPEELFDLSIQTMLDDYDRSQTRTALNSEELDQYYYNTFAPILNLMFIGFQSKLRVSQDSLADLALCQGHIYTLRDLKDDWENGIINIPSEILIAQNISTNDSYQKVFTNQAVQQWIASEIHDQKIKVLQLQAELEQAGEKFTLFAVNFSLLKHMLKALNALSFSE
jgi:phytoene/squalene synthetase